MIDALTPSTLYAGTLAGVFRSRDWGETWTAVNNGMTGRFLYVWCLAIDPVSPDTLYAGMQDGVFRTTDQGDHWTAVNSGLSGPNVWSLALDPLTPSTLYYVLHFSQFGKGLGFTSDVVLTNPSAFTAVSGTIAPGDPDRVGSSDREVRETSRPDGTSMTSRSRS